MTVELTASAFVARLEAEANEEQRVAYRRYFPGDESFIGVRMGTVFAIAKEFLATPLPEIEALLESPMHEARAGACSVMGKAATHKKVAPERHEGLYELYLRRHDRIDDWDLVDLAAHQVLGTWLLDRPRDPLYDLAFLDELAARMPRAMLRAAIEKLDPAERKHYLAANRPAGSAGRGSPGHARVWPP